jgi:hypothetical protein
MFKLLRGMAYYVVIEDGNMRYVLPCNCLQTKLVGFVCGSISVGYIYFLFTTRVLIAVGTLWLPEESFEGFYAKGCKIKSALAIIEDSYKKKKLDAGDPQEVTK